MGARWGESAGWSIPRDYGDPEGEYSVVRRTVGLADLSHRGKLRITGPDRVKFLQGLVTNDVAGTEVGQGVYCLMLTAKGRAIFDLTIYVRPDSLLAELEPEAITTAIQTLGRYRLVAKATLHNATEELGLLALHGPGADAVLARVLGRELPDPPRPELAGFEAETASWPILATVQKYTGGPGYHLFVPREGLAEVWESLAKAVAEQAGRPVGHEALRILRIEAGIPRLGDDLDERVLPPEAGLEARAISYTKGCYIGQEVMARIQTYGRVHRRLAGLRLKGPDLPAKGALLYHDQKEVGWVTSACASPRLGPIALGYVHRDAAAPQTSLCLGEPQGTECVVSDLPFPYCPDSEIR